MPSRAYIAALGDAHAVLQGVRGLKHRRHFFRRFQEELLGVVPQAFRIAERLPRADAEQDVVRVRVGLTQVMHVVGADQRKLQIARDRGKSRVDGALLLDAVPLHFEEEIVRPQNVAVGGGRRDSLLFLLVREPFRNLTLQAAAEPDEALGMLGEEFFVDARLAVELPYSPPTRV